MNGKVLIILGSVAALIGCVGGVTHGGLSIFTVLIFVGGVLAGKGHALWEFEHQDEQQ
jgi:hypothetical protein